MSEKFGSGNPDKDVLSYSRSVLIPILVKAIQEQQVLIEKQQQYLSLLEKRIKELEDQILSF
jgi:hypothetical protein